MVKAATNMLVTGARSSAEMARRFVDTVVPPDRSEYTRVRLHGRDDEEDLNKIPNSFMPDSAVDESLAKEKSEPDHPNESFFID